MKFVVSNLLDCPFSPCTREKLYVLISFELLK
jgi:hypothetical protein